MGVQSKMWVKGAIALAAAAGAAAIFYFLTAEEKFYMEVEDQHQDRRRASWTSVHDASIVDSSTHSTVEVPVPAYIIGALIGRHSCNIVRIQRETDTKINFKNQVIGDDVRMATIRGKIENVLHAELEVKRFIADRLNVVTYEMEIPSTACVAVIGANILMINETCKAKVEVGRTRRGQPATTSVIISGPKEDVEYAKDLIMERVVLNDRFEAPQNSGKLQLSTSTRQYELAAGNKLYLTMNGDHAQAPGLEIGGVQKTEELVATAQDGFIEVFVSAVSSPSRFWVQPIGSKAIELDKLDEQMSEFYADPGNSEEHLIVDGQVEIGEVIAAPFGLDESWYRARVIEVNRDEYDQSESTVLVYYVDYGEVETLKMSTLRRLKHAFLAHLPFQAVECALANASPSNGGTVWSPEAIEQFERLTYSAQWKVIMVKVEGRSADGVNQVTMVDTNAGNDVDICETLAGQGLAIRVVGGGVAQ